MALVTLLDVIAQLNILSTDNTALRQEFDSLKTRVAALEATNQTGSAALQQHMADHEQAGFNFRKWNIDR